MKKITLALLIALAFTVTAQESDAPKRSKQWLEAASRTGEEWIPAAWTGDEAKPYIMVSLHRDRFKRNEHVVEAWRRVDYVPFDTLAGLKDKVEHAVSKVVIDCVGNQMKTVSSIYYDRSGNVVDSDRDDYAKFSEMAPGTLGEEFVYSACGFDNAPSTNGSGL